MKQTQKAYKDTSPKNVPLVPMQGIYTWNCPTRKGNTVSVFFNTETNLLVVDIVAGNEKGGNEVLRRFIDEGELLAHTV